MTRKPPELPDIEDATLRACLAPLMEARTAGAETIVPIPPPSAARPVSHVRALPSGSNDNPAPPVPRATENTVLAETPPITLAEWRSLADEEFGTFRMIEMFLTRTDGELERAASEFPKQLSGTLARLSHMKERLAARYDAVTSVQALLRRALARAADGGEGAGRAVPGGTTR